MPSGRKERTIRSAFVRLTTGSVSETALQQATWKEFERFTVHVLRRYYAPFGLKLTRTVKRGTKGVGGDGARDAEAAIVLGGDRRASFGATGTSEQLGVVLTLWVEVKQRSKGNVGAEDFGGTWFRSLLEPVSKLIFVCNRGFTHRFQTDLAAYASLSRTQFGLVDGRSLVRIARSLEEARRTKSTRSVAEHQRPAPERLVARVKFSADQVIRAAPGIEATTFEKAVNEPLFISVDCSAGRLSRPIGQLAVELRHDAKSPVGVLPRYGSQQWAVGAGDHFQSVFTVVPTSATRLKASDFTVRITGHNRRRIPCRTIRSMDRCVIRRTLLPDWVPPAKTQVLDAFKQSFEACLNSETPGGVDLIAIAGAGKTHLVSLARQVWLRSGATEIGLDGRSESTASSAALAVLHQLVPIPIDDLEDPSGALVDWLVTSGLGGELGTRIAQDLHAHWHDRELQTPPAQLGELLAALLTRRADREPLVLVFEDLHKCTPTTIRMLSALRDSLGRVNRGRVFTLFTRREDSVWDETVERTAWRSSVRGLRTAPGISSLMLRALDRGDAMRLIQRAVPEIEEHQVRALIDQVGTTPFGIRESLGLLVGRTALEPAVENGVWRLVDPDELKRSLETDEMREATHFRLLGLRERHPDWLADFLDSGACLGASFDIDVCASTVELPSRRSLESALAECRLLQIIRPSERGPNEIQFDHDLIRGVLLQHLGAFRQRRLARSLFTATRMLNNSSLSSSLAYQAGLGDDCWTETMRSALQSEKAHRHMEAVHALGLALAVTDQNVAAAVFAVDDGRYHPAFDDAIAVAEPVIRTGLTRRQREQETVSLLLRYVEHLVSVGSGSTPSVDNALTEAAILAEVLDDDRLRAVITMYHGRREFNADKIGDALALHEAAEVVFSKLGSSQEILRLRCANMLRLAIAYRQDGRLKESRETLLTTHRLRGARDVPLSVSIRANFGATYFYTDWRETRRHWEKALALATRHDLRDREVHCAVDVGHLDLLEDKLDDAESRLAGALLTSRELGLENSELRCLLNIGCSMMMREHFRDAIDSLRDADRLGFRHGIGRRLWRVRANLGTAYCLVGDFTRSSIADRQVVRALLALPPTRLAFDAEAPSSGRRLLLAVANIALRSRFSPAHRELLELMPDTLRKSATEIADAVSGGSETAFLGLRSRHCKAMGTNRFFIITE